MRQCVAVKDQYSDDNELSKIYRLNKSVQNKKGKKKRKQNQTGISFNVDLQIEFIILKFKNSFKMGPLMFLDITL